MFGFIIASIALLATAVLADNLPACAQSCVTNYNGCSQFDVACICGSSAWIESLACCVSKVCSAADQQATINFANTICASVSVTNLPQTATCAAGSSFSFTTGAATISATAGTAGNGTTATISTTVGTAVNGTTATTMIASVSSTSSTNTATAAMSASSGAANINNAGSIGLGALLAGLVAAI